ncbi:MAG: CysB family HTH-type transcriptional regulator [Aquabacterium sp.]|uniref:CysB family HTH-type transcriptional regulator n=1 Tax=Aquabacterium sp. TaxID=1872578 RepID=UPI0012255DEB|nr:CysB family HTH-type transcriptional regulator [Aquabacterium sp.]TAK99172.1 MAG: CysB family HTH-type transcriptional regulator [Aquabacterium sp.]
MNFQQLRSVREAVRRGFNLTEVAHALHTSQPGVSRQIRELEEELGIDLFVRAGKRLTGLTEPGRQVLPIVERLLSDSESLRQASRDFSERDVGPLSIAATHSQARYALPSAVRDFRQLYPQVTLSLHQGSPKHVAEMLLSGEADVGIATEALTQYEQLVTLPCYQWTHAVVVPPNHALLDGQPLTLERLSRFPLITYDVGYTGRAHIDEAFEEAGITPSVVLSAMDADVIKTYVELGMGVGIVASIAFDQDRDRNLRAIEARSLFKLNMTRLAFRRDAYLRSYVYAFIETFAPPLTRQRVEAAARLSSAKQDDDAQQEAA